MASEIQTPVPILYPLVAVLATYSAIWLTSPYTGFYAAAAEKYYGTHFAEFFRNASVAVIAMFAVTSLGVTGAWASGSLVIPGLSPVALGSVTSSNNIPSYTYAAGIYTITIGAICLLSVLVNYFCWIAAEDEGSKMPNKDAKMKEANLASSTLGHSIPIGIYVLMGALRQRNAFPYDATGTPFSVFETRDQTPANIDVATVTLVLLKMAIEFGNAFQPHINKILPRIRSYDPHGHAVVTFTKESPLVGFHTFEEIPLTLTLLTLGWAIDFYGSYSGTFLVAVLLFVVWMFSGWHHPERFWSAFTMIWLIFTAMQSFPIWGAHASGPFKLVGAFVPNADFFVWSPIVFPTPTSPYGLEYAQVVAGRYMISIFALCYLSVYSIRDALVFFQKEAIAQVFADMLDGKRGKSSEDDARANVAWSKDDDESVAMVG